MGLELTDKGLEAALYVSEGDLRRGINLLQSAGAFSKAIDEDVIYGVVAKARPEDIRRILQTALTGDFMKAREALRELVVSYGMSGEDVVGQFHREVFNLPIPEDSKVRLADIIGEYDFRLTEGSNELIQMEALLAQFVSHGKKIINPP